jgi:death on curing protein
VKWIELNRVLAIHDEQIAEHGGLSGVGDIGLLESALARPQHLAHYGKPDIADLAACYAAGIAKNHAFTMATNELRLWSWSFSSPKTAIL